MLESSHCVISSAIICASQAESRIRPAEEGGQFACLAADAVLGMLSSYISLIGYEATRE